MDVEKAMNKVLGTDKKSGAEGGIMCLGPDESRSAVGRGLNLIAIGADYDHLMGAGDIALKAAGSEWMTDHAC